MEIFLGLLGGVALLYFGGEGLVRGGVSLALRFGIRPLIIGLTIVAMGTSMPELVVSMGAALDGYGGIALGNVVGSNIANIALILGISALIKPITVQRRLVQAETPIALVVTLILVLLLLDGRLGRIDGVLLLVGFVTYIGYQLREASRSRAAEPAEADLPGTQRPWVSALFILGGLAMLILGGRVFVDAAVALAEWLNVPRALIGLTIVAVGTSLPEMATSIIAAVRGHSDLSLGNVVGSNIFNILCILGITALIQPFDQGDVALADLLVMIAATALLIPLMISGYRVSRAEGLFLLLLYAAYIIYLLSANRIPTP